MENLIRMIFFFHFYFLCRPNRHNAPPFLLLRLIAYTWLECISITVQSFHLLSEVSQSSMLGLMMGASGERGKRTDVEIEIVRKLKMKKKSIRVMTPMYAISILRNVIFKFIL